MALPTFLVIGAQKAGTTSLHAYLSKHPDIWMPAEKEPHFFVPERRLGDRDWYEGLFEPGAVTRHRGEASPGYTMFPILSGAPRRIVELLPNVRLIYLIRQPIERMRSAYLQTLAGGGRIAHGHGSLQAALLSNLSFLAPSLYMLQIRQYLEVFDRTQLLVLTTEQLRDHRQDALDSVLAHLGLPAGWVAPNLETELNRSDEKVARHPVVSRIDDRLADRRWYGGRLRHWMRTNRFSTRPFRPNELELADELRGRLLELVRPDLEALVEFMGADFDAWGLLD